MALPITTKQIDGGMLLDPEVSTQRSSTKAFYSSDKKQSGIKPNAKTFGLKRGRSQQASGSGTALPGAGFNDQTRRSVGARGHSGRNHASTIH